METATDMHTQKQCSDAETCDRSLESSVSLKRDATGRSTLTDQADRNH